MVPRFRRGAISRANSGLWESRLVVRQFDFDRCSRQSPAAWISKGDGSRVSERVPSGCGYTCLSRRPSQSWSHGRVAGVRAIAVTCRFCSRTICALPTAFPESEGERWPRGGDEPKRLANESIWQAAYTRRFNKPAGLLRAATPENTASGERMFHAYAAGRYFRRLALRRWTRMSSAQPVH